MNRALIAHLDAIEGRLTGFLLQIITEQSRQRELLGQIQADIAGMKVEHATHRHDDE